MGTHSLLPAQSMGKGGVGGGAGGRNGVEAFQDNNGRKIGSALGVETPFVDSSHPLGLQES